MIKNTRINKKPIVAMELSSRGKGGGPYTSTSRIMSSGLSNDFEYKTIHYDINLGSGISWKRIKDIRRQIISINPDIVHFTGLQLSGFHMAVACRLAGVKNSLVTVRGMSGDAIYFKGLKRFLLMFVIEPLTLLLVKKVYCVSEFVASRNAIKLFSWKSAGAIYNYPPHAVESYSKVELREEYGFCKDDIVVVSIARINKEKGYHVLEKAIDKLASEVNIKFLIAGEGDYLDEMKSNLGDQVASGKVKFIGYTSEVQKVNASGDIFVLPTLHETLSVALLEASVAKLALVSSRTGGTPEIVEDGFNGILVTPNDSDEIYSAILKLSKDDGLRRKFAENAYKKVYDKFSAEEISGKIRSVYNHLLGRKSER